MSSCLTLHVNVKRENNEGGMVAINMYSWMKQKKIKNERNYELGDNIVISHDIGSLRTRGRVN